MKDFFSNPWMSGIIVGLIMVIAFIYHSGQTVQSHADRLDYLESRSHVVDERLLQVSSDVQNLQITDTSQQARLQHLEALVERIDAKVDTLIVAVARIERHVGE